LELTPYEEEQSLAVLPQHLKPDNNERCGVNAKETFFSL
jgi:hypothetical protein